MNDLALLLLRLCSGGFMFTHGWSKITNYAIYATQFGDPIGLGPQMSLNLAIFAEAGCAALLVLGLFSRLALIPLMVTMSVAAFIAHGADPFSKKDLALMYLIMYSALFLMGPGKYSMQQMFRISVGRFSWLLN